MNDLNINSFLDKNKNKVAITLHGAERNDNGGPSVRAPMTAKLLSQWSNYEGILYYDGEKYPDSIRLAHIFNLWPPDSCRLSVFSALDRNIPVVLSTIFLDLSEGRYFRRIPQLFRQYYSEADFLRRLSALRSLRTKEITQGQKFFEYFPGQFEIIRDILNKVSKVILLSNHELELFRKIGFRHDNTAVVYNPVDFNLFANANPRLFQNTWGVSDYILCVGRIEPRKNQLLLAWILRNLDIPLVFIGGAPQKEYLELTRRFASRNTIFTGRIDNKELLASAYAGARVFCLPSWAEGAPLAALEAGAAGCSLVLSDRSAEKEYFGEIARYISPDDPESIREAIINAWENPFGEKEREQEKVYVRDNFSWQAYIEKTVAVYNQAINNLDIVLPTIQPETAIIYIDITTTAGNNGPLTGIGRVEMNLARRLYIRLREKVRFVVWNSARRVFIESTPEQFFSGEYKLFYQKNIPSWLLDCVPAEYDFHNINPNTVWLIPGGSWMRNKQYLQDLRHLRMDRSIYIVPIIHDLIRWRYPHWHNSASANDFSENLLRLLPISSCIICYSMNTANDLREFCRTNNACFPQIKIIRLGDIMRFPNDSGSPHLKPIFDRIGLEPFVLCVSALDPRKNHSLLYKVWGRLLEENDSEAVPHLICVGQKLQNMDNFLEMLKYDPLASKKIHILYDINDDTLDWLYQNCLFTVYPSLYEGWGIPVGESLAYGKICVASNAASISEIAPEYTDLLDPLDFAEWRKRISLYIVDENTRKNREMEISNYQAVSWDTSSEMLSRLLTKTSFYRPVLPYVAYHQLYKPCADTDSWKYFGSGWDFDRKGAWTIGKHCMMAFRSPSCTGTIRFHFKAWASCREGERQKIDVYVNKEHATILQIGINPDVYSMEISTLSELEHELETVIEFIVENPLPPANYKKNSKDTRALGFMMMEFCLLVSN